MHGKLRQFELGKAQSATGGAALWEAAGVSIDRGNLLLRQPIDDRQIWDAGELSRVARDECRFVGAGNGGDHQIVRANQLAGGGEVCSNRCVVASGRVVEGQ